MRARWMAAVGGAWVLGLLHAPGALACPDCPVGLAARAAAFDERFWPTLGLLLLPLLIAIGVVIALHFLGWRVLTGEAS